MIFNFMAKIPARFGNKKAALYQQLLSAAFL